MTVRTGPAAPALSTLVERFVEHQAEVEAFFLLLRELEMNAGGFWEALWTGP
jgi:hypothetical protein